MTIDYTHYKNRKSPRASWWDYRTAAAYFITIVTQNRQHYFGHISNGIMHLSHAGIIADVLWYETQHHFPTITLHAFVVMPNHIHGIIVLNAATSEIENVGTGHAPSVPSLSTVVGSYKSAVTKHCNRLQLPNGWQTRFRDHIIRNEKDWQRIVHYIENNPKQWQDDRFNL